MRSYESRTVLFTGHAPVHFACFRPLYLRLTRLPGFEVFLSGGLETKTESGVLYDGPAMYRPFGVPAERILSVEEIRRRDFDILFGANTKILAPRNAGAVIQIFHGISFRNKAIRQENMGYDHYFMVGPYMRRKFVQAGLFAEDDPRILEIGFPKTDSLLDGTLDRRRLLRRYGFDGSRPVLLYAPTGQRHNSLETMGEEVIGRLRKERRFDLLVKPHDHPKDASIDCFARLAGLEDDHTRIVRDPDVVPLLYLADLLLTDASSVSSEYSLVNRPMVFLDVPKLLGKSVQKDPMLDLASWGRRGGLVAKGPEEVVEAVSESLAQPERLADVREAMAKDLFYNPGAATERAMAWIEETFA